MKAETLMETVANQLTKTEYQRRMDAIRLIPTAIRAAIALDLDKDAAIHGANRAVAVITGINVLELFNGKAPKQDQPAPVAPIDVSRDMSGHINLMAGHGDPDYLTKSGNSIRHVDLREKPPRKARANA